MSHKLVMILTNDDGEKVDSPVWHLVTSFGDAERTVCSGEVFGQGESIATFKEKTVEKGVPCKRCAEIVKWYKSIKL